MRAARLLHVLLLLQNRGRMTSAQLASEVEVTPRTILRDVDAMTEAGLPVIVHRGNAGGIELGFNYRTRLTGLAADEAEALGVLFGVSAGAFRELGIEAAADRAQAKLLESLPDGVREKVREAMARFQFAPNGAGEIDPRVPAIAGAIRNGNTVRLNARAANPRAIQPAALVMSGEGWSVIDDGDDAHPIPQAEWGDINISRVKRA